jgi:hypothetical protein
MKQTMNPLFMKLRALVYSADFWTFFIGLIGFGLIVAGVVLISVPAGLICAGIMLNAWSFIVARSLAQARRS